MYLSSHPLDEYSVIVKNLCSVQLTQFANLEDLKGKDFLVGGMVTNVTNLTTRDGKPYGRFKLEDYSGEHEFTLFSREYEQFRPYLFENYSLLIKGSVRPKTYKPEELEVRLQSMTLLSKVKEEAVGEVIANIFLEEITPEFVELFTKQIKRSKGKSRLHLRIRMVWKRISFTCSRFRC